ncbi:MAG: hypothetical protein IIB69_11260 [Proteobacteria bacterium]|nr:hypothetical protein [Pseudomonadota bacterium]
MGIKAQNQFSPEWFTPIDVDELDRDIEGDATDEGEPRARFKIRGLTGSQQAEIMPGVDISADGSASISGPSMSLLLKYGLLDWENFEDATGPVRFDKINRINQDRLDYPVQVQLAGKIFALTFPDDDDKKK